MILHIAQHWLKQSIYVKETLTEDLSGRATLTTKSLATLDGEIVDPEIAVKLEMWDVFKVQGVQT